MQAFGYSWNYSRNSREEGKTYKGERELQYLFMAPPTDFTLLGSSSKTAVYAYHRNGSTQSHRLLLQSRMSHFAQPETQLNFKTSGITSMPHTTKEQQQISRIT